MSDIITKEMEFRLGDLINEEIQANASCMYVVKDGVGTFTATTKHERVGMGDDLDFFAEFSGDISIPVTHKDNVNAEDRATSKNGYVFSYARAVGDNKVGLLNDHWLYNQNVVFSEQEKKILWQKYKLNKRMYEYLETQQQDPTFHDNFLQKKITNWKEEVLSDLTATQTMTMFDSSGKKIEVQKTVPLDDQSLTLDRIKQMLLYKEFAQKKPKLIWRGAQSGGFSGFQKNRGYDKKAVERKDIVEYYKNNPSDYIDIAVNQRDMGLLDSIIHANTYHKYLLYLQGNDFGSNTYWIYGTSCVVFRPDFLKSHTAWDCHLEPWKHYVPFDHADLGDLVEKIKWCENNHDKCIDIINNANELNHLMQSADHRRQVYEKMLPFIRKNLQF